MLLMELSDLEKIEDMYPDLKFYVIDIPNPHYHGHIVGRDVYINENQPELDWLVTMLHEAVHYQFDSGDLSKVSCCRQTLMAEGFARKQSKRELEELIGDK